MSDQVHRQEFDHKTAFKLLSGRTVSLDAIRKFVAASRAAHDDRESLRSVLSHVRQELTARWAEIEMIKQELMTAEEDAARYKFAVSPGAGGSMNWLNVYEAWNGDGDFTAAIDAARAAKGGA